MFESYLWFRRGGGGLEAGAKTWFYADSAPDGWTIDVTVADALLALKGGSQAYNVDGGNLAGTWTQPNHTLTADEIPAHTHGEAGAHTHTITFGYGGGYDVVYTVVAGMVTGSTSGTTTSGGAHTHTSVGGGGAHNHGATYRPYACLGIVCSKDGAGSDIPAGTKTWLYANSAPSGWTVDETPSDRLIGVKGGSQAFNASGGTMAGTWTQPGHVLTASEIPAHTHGAASAHTHNMAKGSGDVGGYYGGAAANTSSYGTTSSSGAHTHASVGTDTAHSHGSSYRPLARVGLICSKNSAGNFGAGQTTFFYQSAAPENWTMQSFTDGLLAVKGGSVYTTGASEQGTWTQPNCTLTSANLPAHTHGEAGAHTHQLIATGAAMTLECCGESGGASYISSTSPTSASGGAHTHTSYGGGGAHNHGNTWRPYAAVGLICTKD